MPRKAYYQQHKQALAAYERERRAAGPCLTPEQKARRNETQRARRRLAGQRPQAELQAEWAATRELRYAAKNRANAMRHRRKTAMTELDVLARAEAAALAVLREKLCGGQWHVDHIVPLKGKVASGLNTAANLQVVPAQWNRSKGNRHHGAFWAS